MRERRTFSREYKLAAVKKVIEQGLTYAQVARDLGIRDNLLHNWQKALEADGERGERGHTHSSGVYRHPSVTHTNGKLQAFNRQRSASIETVSAGRRLGRERSLAATNNAEPSGRPMSGCDARK
jgi:transposase-like protein